MMEHYPGSARHLEIALDDGSPICLRPMTRADRDRVRQGIGQLSSRSRYFRFFSGFAEPPTSILDLLLDIDGQRHIAWCALDLASPQHPAIAAAHVVSDQATPSQQAELAFAVVDSFHHKGLARLLLAAVLNDALQLGVLNLRAEVLSENRASARLLRTLGAHAHGPASETIWFQLQTSTALAALKDMKSPRALRQILDTFD
jgi:RimJ/RimL family protein N-acetyltransferase